MKYFILSLRPKYWEQIKEGSKRVEFRRKFPSVGKNQVKFLVYVTRPVSKIVGEFTSSSIVRNAVDPLLKVVEVRSVEEEFELREYFKGTNFGVAICIEEVFSFKEGISLSEINVHAPVSYLEIQPEVYAKITSRDNFFPK
jgi:predicted transcriptional regulator